MILNLKLCFQKVVKKVVRNHAYFDAIHTDFRGEEVF